MHALWAPRGLLAALLSVSLLPSLLHAAASANVRVNGVGYHPSYSKRATVLTATGNNAFALKRHPAGTTAFSGTLSNTVNNAETGETVRIANFDGLSEAGVFYVDVTGVGSSVTFTVAPDAFNESYWLNLMGFYNQRCGVATSMTWHGRTWGHAACHLNDGNLTYYSGSNTTRNGTGGWHDAGDFGKYVVNAGAAIGPMLHAWERYSSKLSGVTLPYATDPTLPDPLEEVKFELEWLRKMQFPDGKVSHKLTRTGFEAYPLMPNADSATRYFVPWSTAATADFVAMMALAARVYQPYDATYAITLRNAAWLSYGCLTSSAEVHPDQAAFSTGGYDSSDADDRVWAAAELWETTGDAGVLSYLEGRITAIGTDKSDFRWDWADLQDLGVAVYALSARGGRNATLLADVRADIVADANTMVSNRNANGYGRSLGAYGWGFNGSAAGNAYVLDVANRISPNSAYLDTAHDQLAWLYGRNYYNRSQVTGEGINPPMAPHDRESSADGVAPPKPGHLVGGGHTATDWVDEETSYSHNEIAINWDAAMNYALAMFVDYYGPAPTATPTPSITPTRTPLPCGVPATFFRVDVGNTTAAFTDSGGAVWAADKAFAAGSWGYTAGGTISGSVSPVAATADDPLYQTQRWGNPVSYAFTVPNGSYTVTIKLSESYWVVAGARVFDAVAEGQVLADNVDIRALAGASYRALDLSFTVGVADGLLELSFPSSVDNATLAGIQVDTAVSGPCASPTFTPSSTRSPSPSRTLTRTPSPSPSRTASPTRSPTATPTSSPTASPTQTAGSSATATPTASPSATATGTATPSLTRTVSATVTESATDSPTALGTYTQTPTFSSSPTASPTATVSPTLTATASGTATLTDSPTATESPLATETDSPTATESPLATETDSPTATPSPGETSTATATPSRSATPEGSSTATPSPSGSPTPAPSASATPSPALSASPTPAGSATVSPTAGATAAVQRSSEPPILKEAVAALVTGPDLVLHLRLEGEAEKVELKVYTRAEACIGRLSREGAWGPGWASLSLPLPAAANGAYFFRLEVSGHGGSSRAGKAGKFFVLR